MKIKTADLTDPALDWAAAKCESVEVEYINDGITRCILRVSPFTGVYRPTVDWAQGGPVIEREHLQSHWAGPVLGWAAMHPDYKKYNYSYGPPHSSQPCVAS